MNVPKRRLIFLAVCKNNLAQRKPTNRSPCSQLKHFCTSVGLQNAAQPAHLPVSPTERRGASFTVIMPVRLKRIWVFIQYLIERQHYLSPSLSLLQVSFPVLTQSLSLFPPPILSFTQLVVKCNSKDLLVIILKMKLRIYPFTILHVVRNSWPVKVGRKLLWHAHAHTQMWISRETNGWNTLDKDTNTLEPL